MEQLQPHLLMLMPCASQEDAEACRQVLDQAQAAASRQLAAVQSASPYIATEAGSQVA